MKDLTDRQQQILGFIEEFQDREGMAPTVTEISDFFGIKSSSAFAHLKALERKKQLSRSSKARSINTFSKNQRSVRLFGGSLIIPLLGRVNAGLPGEAVENIEQELVLDNSIVNAKNPENLFALKIQGESMRDIGMFENDIIIVERSVPIKNGDIVVALVNNEVTVKTFFKRDSVIELHPANKDYQVQVYPANLVDIQGKVLALQRKF